MIRLHRSVSVSTFDAAATVAVGRKRPEFLAVAQLAADLARPITSHDVLQELLGKRSEILGRRVMERCISLGLLEKVDDHGNAALSEAGRLALSHGEVLVPEEGIWRFYLVNDPLIPTTLLHARRLEPETKQKERHTNKNGSGKSNQQRSQSCPELLQKCQGIAPSVSIVGGHLLKVLEHSTHGTAGPQETLQLALIWESKGSALLSLTGDMDNFDQAVARKPVDFSIEPPETLIELGYERMWRALASFATGIEKVDLEQWHERAAMPVVPAAFESLSEIERKVFRRDVSVRGSRWDAFGDFEPTVLKNSHIVPASAVDAQAWAEWLQWEAIDDYVTPGRLEQISRTQRTKFPYHAPRFLGPDDLVAKARRELASDKRTFLLAPFDLGLWS